jgi:hypothetical protein
MKNQNQGRIKMKAIKMIGLTALLALLAMAFVGATSAMAESTALCTADETECALANLTESVHETSVGKAKLLTSLGTTECNVLFSGSVEETGNPLVIEGSFTYTNCTFGGSSCTATEESGPAEIKVLKEGHETGKVTGEGLVHLVCGSSIDCSYNGTGLVGTAKGPLLSTQTNGEVTLSEVATTKETGGFLCPKSAKLDITTTPLSATYISGGGANPQTMACIEVSPKTGLLSNSTCTTMANNREGSYELGWVKRGLAVTEHACAFVHAPNGLFLTRNAAGTECQNVHALRDTFFELGTIVALRR